MNMTSTVGVPAVLSGTTADLERELFHVAVRGLAEGTCFYQDTDERFIALAAHLALADDGWLVRFIGWLRSYDELASAAVVAAAEMARTRLAAGLTTSGGNRNVISSVLLRADEPGELLGYWFRRYGRSVPHPIRNGLADAARNLYHEKTLATYDLTAQQVRFADVISLVHPKAATRNQEEGEHPAAALPDHVPSYIWNVASASNSGGESMTGARRHVFSGLTDGAFTVIPLVEGAYRNSWPF